MVRREMLLHIRGDSTHSQYNIFVYSFVVYSKFWNAHTTSGYHCLEYNHRTNTNDLVETLIFEQSMEFLRSRMNSPVHYLFYVSS